MFFDRSHMNIRKTLIFRNSFSWKIIIQCFVSEKKRRENEFLYFKSVSFTDSKRWFSNVSSVRMNYEWVENIIEYICNYKS